MLELRLDDSLQQQWVVMLGEPTGVFSKPNSATFEISLNPSSTYINIVYNIERNATLTFTDAYGRVVKQLTLYPYFKNRIIYTDGLGEGVYLVTLSVGEKRASKKLVVAR